MNFHRASNSVVRGIKRRLETAKPPSQLVEDSVKRMRLPGTHHEITLFIAESDAGRVFVAELKELDLPHIYQAFPLPDSPTIPAPAQGFAAPGVAEISQIMMKAILGIAQTVHADPRFRRNIITLATASPSIGGLSDNALARTIQQLNGRVKAP